jgi:hypothetical protein
MGSNILETFSTSPPPTAPLPAQHPHILSLAGTSPRVPDKSPVAMHLKEAYSAPQICQGFLLQAESKKDGAISNGCLLPLPLPYILAPIVPLPAKRGIVTLHSARVYANTHGCIFCITRRTPSVRNFMESSPSEKLAVAQLVRKFSAFWATWRLIAVFMRIEIISEVSINRMSAIFWDVTPWALEAAYRSFVVPPSSRPKNKPRKHPSLCFVTFCLGGWLILRPWSWRQHVPQKLLYMYTSTRLHGVTSQNAVHSILFLCSQELISSLYPEPDESSPQSNQIIWYTV